MQPPVYVINLKRAVARRERMQRLLAEVGIEPIFVEAVDGRALGGGDVDGFTRSQMRMSDPEFGCLLSHVKTWRLIAASDHACGVVLEDDVRISRALPDVIAHMSPDKDDIGIWRLETFMAHLIALRKYRVSFRSWRAFEIFSHHYGTAGYMISHRSAYKLLKESHKMRLAIDTEMFDPGRQNIERLPVYQIHPAPCIQEMCLEPRREDEFASEIAGTRFDDQPKIVHRTVATLREILRPVYNLICNCYFWPSGKARLHSQPSPDVLDLTMRNPRL